MKAGDDFEDRELADRLGRAGGSYPDVNAAYATVIARAGSLRRRRQFVVASGAAAAIVGIVLLAGIVLRGRNGGERLVVATSPTTVAPATIGGSTSSSSTSTSSTSSTSTSTTVVTTTAASTSAPADSLPVLDTQPVTPATNAPVTTKRRPSTSAPVVTPAPTTSPTTPAPPTAPPTTTVTATFGGAGGSIEVRTDGNSLTIVSTNPAQRYTADVRDGFGRRIEVRFTSRWHRTTIRVELRGTTMVPDVDESSNTTSTTPPATESVDAPTTTPGSHTEGGDWDGDGWNGDGWGDGQQPGG